MYVGVCRCMCVSVCTYDYEYMYVVCVGGWVSWWIHGVGNGVCLYVLAHTNVCVRCERTLCVHVYVCMHVCLHVVLVSVGGDCSVGKLLSCDRWHSSKWLLTGKVFFFIRLHSNMSNISFVMGRFS